MKQVALISKIAPEMKQLVERRHAVLQTVAETEPVGRRSLAITLGWPERTVRREIDFLRDVGLLHADGSGMMITDAGRQMVVDLQAVIRQFHGLNELERELETHLGLRHVIIVPGDSDVDDSVKKEIAAETARFLSRVLVPGDVLAVTGGTTLAEVARRFPEGTSQENVTVVPARGGLGEDVELQANTVAANIANRIGGTYRLLHVPDDLGQDAIDTLAQDPKIKELIDLIRSARLLLHGIGSADEMARRRGLAPQYVDTLKARHAVGEAFGYYFDQSGHIVFRTSSVGVRFQDLAHIDTVVAVGGGRSKAAAAIAVLKTQRQHVYITDEGAALEMLARLR